MQRVATSSAPSGPEDRARSARNKLQSTLDTMQQMVVLDAEQEANELPFTSLSPRPNERMPC
jgi:hypothetical protein